MAETPQSPITLLDLKIEDMVYLSPFEPASGVVLGAYIKSDPLMPSINAFREYIGVSHGIFAHTITLGDAYPLGWVLENIAAGTTPHLTILPPNQSNIYDIDLIRSLAKDAALFNVATFINLFPLQSNSNFTPSQYIAFFQQAYDVFATYAPNVVMVWGVDISNIHMARHFFPGGGYVGWINLIAYKQISRDGLFEDFFDLLDAFYLDFQEEAPIILSLAVSHYSQASNRHFIAEASEKIAHIYSRIHLYPRIRSVIYLNYSQMQQGGGNFTINSNNTLRDAYIKATSNLNIIDSLSTSQPSLRQAPLILHTPHQAAMYASSFYIPIEAITTPLPNANLTIIDNLPFYPLADINRATGCTFFKNAQENFLVIQPIHPHQP